MSGYPEGERFRDLRRVIGALEAGDRSTFDVETAAAALRLERLSSLSLLELVVRVHRSGINLGLRPEPVAEVLTHNELGRDKARPS